MAKQSPKLLGWMGFCLLALGWFMPANAPAGSMPAPTGQAQEFRSGWNAYKEGRYGDAARIWTALAHEGDASAQLNLGSMYDDGIGVPEEPTTAVHWYRAAALQGDRAAQFNLGSLYAMGRGVPKDAAQAAAWCRKAAEQGLAVAQYQLGLWYAEEPGLAQTEGRAGKGDRGLAIEWLARSGLSYLAEGSVEGAQRAIEALEALAPGHERVAELRARLEARETPVPQKSSPETIRTTSIGTAWPVAPGYVVTNNHVVAGKSDVVLVDTSGREMRAWPVVRDEVNDVAVLTTSDVDHLPRALPLATSQPTPGASVFTVGYPQADVRGTTPKRSDGVISATIGPNHDQSNYRTTVPIQPGNSGGPLLNMNGEVVGVITAMIGIQDQATGTVRVLSGNSCALKIDGVKHLLPLLPSREPPPLATPSRPDSLSTLADRIQSSVLMVVAN